LRNEPKDVWKKKTDKEKPFGLGLDIFDKLLIHIGKNKIYNFFVNFFRYFQEKFCLKAFVIKKKAFF
jgi:hypothetical protein